MSFSFRTFPAGAALMLVLAAALVSTISGCASTNRGGIRHSREATNAFERLHVFPGHRYYYLNQENSPYAVVGLERDYRIEDKLYTEVDPGSKTFEKVVGLVQSFPARGSYATGAWILDPQGKRIGAWYSSLNAGIRVDPETKVVAISTAMPWVEDDEWSGSGVGVGIGIGGGRSGVGVRVGF
jgi:hypothetical protein